jgi:hypothetical protein
MIEHPFLASSNSFVSERLYSISEVAHSCIVIVGIFHFCYFNLPRRMGFIESGLNSLRAESLEEDRSGGSFRSILLKLTRLTLN